MSNYKRMQRKTNNWSAPRRKEKHFYNGLIRTRVKKQDEKDLIEEYKHDIFEEDFVQEIKDASDDHYNREGLKEKE